MDNQLLLVFAFISGGFLGAFPFWLLWRRNRKRVRQDDLTGLANYRAFLEQLHAAQRGMQRQKTALGVALTDIDDFRQYNRKGYPCGDRVLQGFARQLSAGTKGIALCARYRLGDEFVLLFKAGDEQKVIEALQGMNHREYGGERVSFSYGLKTFTDASLTDEQLLLEVQALLARDKVKNKRS